MNMLEQAANDAWTQRQLAAATTRGSWVFVLEAHG
jgi:hypothetical protein